MSTVRPEIVALLVDADHEASDCPKPAASCDFPGHPGPAGHVNACQLCPASPTYWRDRADGDNAKPCRWTEAKAA